MKKFDNYRKNLDVLRRSDQQDLNNEFIISGIIDKFSIQFELGWKVLKELLTYEGIDAAKTGSPREIIKQAYQYYPCIEEDVWLDMLSQRNNMAHIYDGNADAYTGFLPLQTLNKVFMYNNTGSKTYDNCWDFVAEGEHGLYMDIDSEIVGKNFLYMLTEDTYAGWLKEAFDALSADEQAYFQPTIDAMASEASDLGLGENGKYALAWIKLWVESYNAQTDDGPICNTLVDKSATDQFGLLVYSKLRSVEESATVSVNNVNVAAYQDGYTGIGGFGYCHYLFVTDNSPLPWTACAFIAYMTCTEDGFSAWGKDMGGYSSNPTVAEAIEATYGHQKGGYVDGVDTFPAKDDHGYEWWTNQGKLVLEDPEYCSSVAFTVGSWIELLTKYSAG